MDKKSRKISEYIKQIAGSPKVIVFIGARQERRRLQKIFFMTTNIFQLKIL